MESRLLKCLKGLRRSHNKQHSLLGMIESCKVKLNNDVKVEAMIMNLSKAFDSLNHKLTDLTPIKLSFSATIFPRNQLYKISSFFSRGILLVPLLFNIFISDIFVFLQKNELSNYTDDSTMWSSNRYIQKIMYAAFLPDWF